MLSIHSDGQHLTGVGPTKLLDEADHTASFRNIQQSFVPTPFSSCDQTH